MNFLKVLLNSLKAKILPIWTKIKLWTNLSFLKTKFVTAIRVFFTKTLSIKPRDKKDYYGLGKWLISKKLCFAIVMIIGVLSLFYLLYVNPYTSIRESDGGIKSYYYDSIPLRFAKGHVNIKAKSGYIAYTGDVAKGEVTGEGTLFAKDGSTVYIGTFDDNKFNGAGRLFYQNGQLRYLGQFTDNFFEGTGSLYRENGSKEYTGGFAKGMKEGEGELFDSANNKIYSGSFTKDHLIYAELLGKSTSEIASMYTGSRNVYRGSDDFVVQMNDINALYSGKSNAERLDDRMMVEGIYVLDNTIGIGDKVCKTIGDLNSVFGSPYYEGNSEVLLAEAIAINCLNESDNSLFGYVDMERESIYADVTDIISYDPDYTVYLYTYRYDGLMYTFFCKEKFGDFAMYMIEKE